MHVAFARSLSAFRFDLVDIDGDGELDAHELGVLYRQARGESLKKHQLRDAMTQVCRSELAWVLFFKSVLVVELGG